MSITQQVHSKSIMLCHLSVIVMFILCVQSSNEPFDNQQQRARDAALPFPESAPANARGITINLNNADRTVMQAVAGAATQPGYSEGFCVAKDCWHCVRLEALVGMTGLCSGVCGACAACVAQQSCSGLGLQAGAIACGSHCAVLTSALGAFYAVKAKCPYGYLWLNKHCPTPFYQKGQDSSDEGST